MAHNTDFFTAFDAVQEQTRSEPARIITAEITPLATVPADVVLTAEEERTLGKYQEYTRRGTMPPTRITRQQLIEDVLARGYSQLETIVKGPFNVVRLSPKAGQKISTHSSRPDYYEFNSRLESAYVVRRHASLFPKQVSSPDVATIDEKTTRTVGVVPPGETARKLAEAGDRSGSEKAEAPSKRTPTTLGTVGKAKPSTTLVPPPESPASTDFVPTSARPTSADSAAEEGIVVPFPLPVPPERPDILDVLMEGEVNQPVSSLFEASPTPPLAPELRPEERDFEYSRGELVAPRGRKGRIEANIAAIELVKQLTAEERLAGPAEKLILAKYSGWGADKEVFNENQRSNYRFFLDDHFGGDKDRFKSRVSQEKLGNETSSFRREYYGPAWNWMENYGEAHDRLKALLNEEQWRSAAASTLNAHYTSEELSHGLWDIARRAGFKGGVVLEPGMGTGHILAAMPQDLKSKSRTIGVELDDVSAKIARYLFPQTEVHALGFQEAPILENSVDLVIANVPFSDVAPAGQTETVKFNLHNYFIAKSMAKLKPGGLAVIVTSASTLQNNDDQRELLATKAQLLGAIRLPNDAFADSANTMVVTDVLLLRKPDRTLRIESHPFTMVLPVSLPEEGVYVSQMPAKKVEVASVNEYFVEHPQMVLGYHSMRGRMYGSNDAGQYTVASPENAPPIEERFAGAVARLPANVPNCSDVDYAKVVPFPESTADVERLSALMDEGVGAIVMREKKLYVVDGVRELVRPPWQQKGAALPKGIGPGEADELVADYCRLRGAFKRLVSTDLNPTAGDDDSEKARQALRAEYQTFTARHGEINRCAGLLALVRSDPDLGGVCALEQVSVLREGRKQRWIVTPSPIFNVRTLRPPSQPTHAGNLQDAVMLSLGRFGHIAPGFVAELTGKSNVREVEDAIAESGQAFLAPGTGLLEAKAKYLSGNIRLKLESAREASATDPRYRRNVAALEAVVPPRVPFQQMIVPLGATWVPGAVVSDFARELLQQPEGFRAAYFPRGSTWMLFNESGWSQASRESYGTKRMNGVEIFATVLNQRPLRIFDTTSAGVRVFNEKETAKVQERGEVIRAAWKKWLQNSPSVQAELETVFNDQFNSVVTPNYEGTYLAFPGLANGPGAKKPMEHQAGVVARILSEQAGTIAHGVGYGKTMSLILIAYEAKRMGIATKPMIVCDNANYAQFVAAYRELYPQARLLCSDETSMQAANRESFMGRIATGDWDTVLVARSHFERIPVSPSTEQRFTSQRLSDLRATLAASKGVGSHKLVRQQEKAIEREEAKVAELNLKIRARADNGICWEQLGVDWLEVDESHREKKCGFATAHEDIKGIDCTESQRGRGMLMKARFIQDRRDGCGVIGATGTPCTNTMAEFWNMNRLFNPKVNGSFGIETFDQFKSAFCETVEALEMNEANGKWRTMTRLAKFVNGPAFISYVRAGMDVRMNPADVKLDLPKRAGGQIEFATVPLTDTTLGLMEELAAMYEAYESSGQKRELSWVPIVLMQVGMAASIDPRLVSPKAPDEPGSVVNRMVKNVTDIHRETAERRSVQCIFLDRYGAMNTAILDQLRGRGVEGVKIQIEDADKLPGRAEEPADGALAVVTAEPEVPPGRFNLYQDIRTKLIAGGVPASEIVIIQDAKTGADRGAVFEGLNEGRYRVVLGSSDKLGIGANFQRKLIAAHHLDPARNMTPDQMEQRSGRIIRQGNENKEVREIYYGMEDTVTPAVFHRIQRKAAFIKQGFASKGVGLEFEDTGEIRLEELKACLITDKRQMRMAELVAEIRDEKMKREVSRDRLQYLHHSLNRSIASEQNLVTVQLPDVQRLAAYFAERVTPPFSATEWTAEFPDKPTIMGEPKEVLKKLEKVVDAWKERKIASSDMKVRLGRVVVNGLPIEILKQQVNLLSDESSVRLVAEVPHPSKPGEPLSASFFGSAEALFKLVQARYEYAQSSGKDLARMLADVRRSIDGVKLDIERHENYDETKLRTLEGARATLESDMRANPYKRGQNRRQLTPVAAAPVAVAGEEVAIDEPVPWNPTEEEERGGVTTISRGGRRV